MRTGIRLAMAAAAMLTVAVSGPASATHGGIHPSFRSERVYFHCAGPIKVQNVALITDGTPSWNTTEPDQSVQEGAGCGAVDPGAARGSGQETIYDAPFSGTFTGNLRDFTVELHNLALSRVRPGELFTVRVRLSIDGTPVFAETAGQFVNVTPVASSTGASEKFLFSITELGCTRDIVDANGNVVGVKTGGFATENGDGTTEHEILLTIDSFAVNQASAWVWDTTEVPSGITFNPSKLETAKLRVDNPASC